MSDTIRIPDFMIKEAQDRLNRNSKVLDWDEVVRNTDNRRAQSIPNTVNNPPGESGIMNRLHENQYQANVGIIEALTDIHRYIVREMTAVVRDNRDIPIDILAAHIADKHQSNQVLAYDKPDFKAFLKLLTFFAISKHEKTTDPAGLAKVSAWFTASQPIFKELKLDAVQKKSLKEIVDAVNKPYTPDKKLTPLMQRARNPLVKLPALLKLIRSPVHKNVGLFHAETKDLRGMLAQLMTYYNSDSDAAYRNIVNSVHLLGDSAFGDVEPEAKIETNQANKNLLDFVKKNGGKGHYLTDDQSAKLKTKNPASHAQYRKHVLGVRDSIRTEIKKLVRASGKDKLQAIPVDDAISKLGLPTDFIPAGFNGFYDENANMYTKQGEQLSTNISGGQYIINKTYDPKKHGHQYVATHDNPRAATPQKIYTMHHVRGVRPDHKADLIEQNSANFDKVQQAWRQDMHKKKGNEADKAHAHLVEALYQTSLRIGSGEGMTDGKRTYGIRTLLKKHVRENANGSLTLTFPGKSGMINKVVIKPGDEHQKKLIDYIKTSIAKKGPNDSIWTIGNDLVKTNEATAYANSKGWVGGLHKLRHMRGADLVKEYMKKHPPKKNMTPKEVNDYVNAVGIAVGTILGHKKTNKEGKEEPVGTTALRSYIDSNVLVDFYREKKAPLPSWLEKIIPKDED